MLKGQGDTFFLPDYTDWEPDAGLQSYSQLFNKNQVIQAC